MAITVKLMGGMGNQMFQYAFGAACAARLGTSVKLDPTLLTHPGRSFALGQWSMYLDLETKPTTIREHGMPYNQQIVDQVKDGDVLQGYWQSEKYFADLIPDALRQVFLPLRPLQQRAQFWMNRIVSSRSCFIHIRRGDYLKEPHKSFHGVLEDKYYGDAITKIWDKVGLDTQFFVFSDDPEYAKEISGQGVFHVDVERESEAIYLMSLCKHAIIANSSFSWWGAWLGDDNKNRTVIAPAKWFTDQAAEDYSDIVPDRWIKL